MIDRAAPATPVRRANLTNLILCELRQFVLTRGLVEHDRLPPERELAQQLRVSRPTLRKALAWLEERGALRRVQGGGTFLQPAFLDVLADCGEIATTGRTTPRELDEARLLFEPQLAALAAERATGRALESLEIELRRGTPLPGETCQAVRWRQHELNFHLRIVQAAGNAAVAQVLEPLLHQACSQPPAATPCEELSTLYRQHGQLFAAISSRDADQARELMREHLAATLGGSAARGSVATAACAAQPVGNANAVGTASLEPVGQCGNGSAEVASDCCQYTSAAVGNGHGQASIARH